MKHLLATLSACAALILGSFPSYGATREQMVLAEQLLGTQKPREALVLLEAAHNPATASVQEFFLLGLSAKLSGDLRKAEQYLRLALQSEPNAGRIRLELAEVLFRQQKLDESRLELVQVQKLSPPIQVQKNIKSFIARIDIIKTNPNKHAQGSQKNWSAYITTGFTSDSNVNAGPNADTVFLYGLPFTLSAEAQETNDGAWFARAGINHRFKLNNDVVWESRANLSFNNYFSMDTYDTTDLSASTGPSFRLGKNMGVSVPIIFNMQSYTEQDDWYSQSWGIAPNLQYKIQENSQLYLSVSATHKRFNGNANRDISSYTFNPSVNFQPTKNGNIALGFNYGREDSDLDIYTNEVRGIYLGYQHNFQEQGIRASITASNTDTQFKGIQAAYTVARHDVSRKLSASMTYTIPQFKGVSVTGTASHQNNNSNLSINNYERTLFSFSLTKRF